jgi:branched-chain amino acid transport system permease protein
MQGLLNIIVVGILLGGIYALVSVGLNLIFGVIRVVNFAQGEFVMLGMYGAYAAYTVFGIGPYWAVLLVVPALFVLGALVQRLILSRLRSEPVMQIFATFGLLLLLQNLVLAATGGAGYTVQTEAATINIALGPVRVGIVRIIILLAATAVAAGLGAFLQRSMLGRAIRAVAQDSRAATLMGVNVERIYMISFGLGAALYSLSPQIGLDFILPAFAVVVLGGLGSVKGAYVGGFIVGMTETLAGYYIDPSLRHAVLFAVFIVVLVVKPSGLFGQIGAEEVGLRGQA